MSKLTDRVAIVSGAAMGMGQAAAIRLATDGATIAIIDRADAGETIEQVKEAGSTAQSWVCDVTDEAQVNETAKKINDAFGRIDILVNNAGNFFAGFFEELTPDQVRAQIETNLFGPMNVTRAVLPVMRRQRSG